MPPVYPMMGVHPTLAQKIGTILAQMTAAGHPMRVCQGLRTEADQAKLYAQGRTAPGPDVSPAKPLGRIVTNCDGVIRKSRHQPTQDGLGHAVDCCFAAPDPFAEHHPWSLYGQAVRAQGLVWGGDWKSPVDRPHAELA